MFRRGPSCPSAMPSLGARLVLAGCHLPGGTGARRGGTCQTGSNWDTSPPVPHLSWLGRGAWGRLAEFSARWDISQVGALRGDGRGWEHAGGLGWNALNAIEHLWSQRAVSRVTGHETKWINGGMLPRSSLVERNKSPPSLPALSAGCCLFPCCPRHPPAGLGWEVPRAGSGLRVLAPSPSHAPS